MSDIRKIIENDHVTNPHEANWVHELQDWNHEIALDIAQREGIEMTDQHWEVITCLRDHYRTHGPAEHGRELSDMLNDTYTQQGGRKYLRRLFPDGPVAQGMTIAGLPVPPMTTDEGFGISF